MRDSFNHIIAIIAFSLSFFAPSADAQSNSKGKDSSVVVGILKEADATGKSLKVLHRRPPEAAEGRRRISLPELPTLLVETGPRRGIEGHADDETRH